MQLIYFLICFFYSSHKNFNFISTDFDFLLATSLSIRLYLFTRSLISKFCLNAKKKESHRSLNIQSSEAGKRRNVYFIFLSIWCCFSHISFGRSSTGSSTVEIISYFISNWTENISLTPYIRDKSLTVVLVTNWVHY